MNIKLNKEEIVKKLDAKSNISDWYDWKWQIKNSIKNLDTLESILNIKFNDEEKISMEKTIEQFPFASTPYYLSIIDIEDYKNDPVYRQAIPDIEELNLTNCDMSDPLHEDHDSPVPGITHRYPDRVLLLVSNVCSMYCRHCTRKRKVGDIDNIPNKDIIMQGIEYIKNHTEIRDVLLSGGDPFLLPDDYLDWILSKVKKIPHVEVIRIGTRTPVVLPQRITDNLVDILKKHHPIWINTHFNHPKELTDESRQSIRRLADAGIPLGNQSVLLAKVNDCPKIMKNLVHKLVANRIRPYYLYQCDLSEGLSHFRTPVGKGIEIIESLIGHTSGFAIPRYVIDAPGGGGKIPVMPNYLISWSQNKVILRNYEGVITTYKEPDNYKTQLCDDDCDNCNLHLNLDGVVDYNSVGITKLLSDNNEDISLTPNDNERIERRDTEEIIEEDKIEKISNSIIHHGKNNDRVYVMKLDKKDIPDIFNDIYNLAYENRYGKIIAKVPTNSYGYFLENDYIREAHIPKFFKNGENLYFMSKYLDENRKIETNEEIIENVLYDSKNSEIQNDRKLADKFKIRVCGKHDINEMTSLYEKVFETYPFPINDNDYLLETMKDNILYFGIWDGNKLIALSSSETDKENLTAEMTDFATHPEYRKIGFASLLLKAMEVELKKRKFRILYTIARAKSHGMNIVFSRNGYEYTGTLTNNTNIFGNIESMNVWYKNII
jgi:lysine 2,3-aminomutase